MSSPPGVPRKRAIADELRAEILAGRRAPGTRFLSEADIAQVYDVSRHTAREVMGTLAREGLIVVRHGHPTRVRDTRDMAVVPVPGPDHYIGARLATQAEADEWGVPVGAAVLRLVEKASRIEVEAWPAERTLLDPAPARIMPE